MTHTITLINGDGIGAEVIPATQRVLQSLNLPLEFQHADAGWNTFERTGNALPPETLALCERSDAVLFGATQSPMTKVEGYKSPILQLRKHFNLYANLRPAVNFKHEIEMLIVRENTEDLYSGRERVENDGATAIAERVITAAASERIVRVACEHAMRRSRTLTIVHKANVMKETCGLFRRVALQVTESYPQLEVNELLVDTAAMKFVMTPQIFDVVVTTNLFGDILSDLAAGLCGGLGLAPSANVGDSSPGVYEPVHGSAPDIAGRGIADPRAAFLSAAMMLLNLDHIAQSHLIQIAVSFVPHQGTTDATTAAVIAKIREFHV
jgi:homoisocitrate dehydrogenase